MDLSDTPVSFRKMVGGALETIGPFFVRCTLKDQGTDIDPSQAYLLYTIIYDNNIQFSDGSKIDGTTFIVASFLSEPRQLDTPVIYTTPISYGRTIFKDEQ